jgi:competence protein ComFC
LNLINIHLSTYHLYKLVWDGLDWIYPPRCGGCNTVGSRWCEDCEKKSEVLRSPICFRCGQSINGGVLCGRCNNHSPSYTALRSIYLFEGPVRPALHRLKYKNDLALGETFSHPLIEMIEKMNWLPDLVVPVPLGFVRQAERGYNQASLLAYPLALATSIPFRSKALRKIRETSSQVGLSFQERRANVKDAFCADRKMVDGKKVLLIDDVCTSGATLEACSIALRKEGAVDIYALTLARARLQEGEIY